MWCAVTTWTPGGQIARCVFADGGHEDHVAGVGDDIDLWLTWNVRTGETSLTAGPACGKMSGPPHALDTEHCFAPAGHTSCCTWEVT
ncbi:hypothetical protein ACIQRS_13580 [Streptomyces termitum]